MNIDLFKTWSPDMAWFLGYIYADGNLRVQTSHGCCLRFECSCDDVELLYHAKRILDSHHKIGTSQRVVSRDSSWLQVTSKALVMNLVNQHGVVPNKSNRDMPFPYVPDEYLCHFVRGYFDGDGTVSDHGLGGKIVAFLGTKQFITELHRKLYFRLGLFNTKLNQRTATCWKAQWQRGKDTLKLYEWMYSSDGLPCLERKKVKLYQGIKSEQVKKGA